MSLRINSDFNGVTDPDAGAYIAAVEAADGNQLLEFAVGKAINDFVVGCKADGIWNAIKASCILAGARTLSGALVPLVGTAPTNNGPFVAGDYNRKTGLVGNGSTKYLSTGFAENSVPQNSIHLAAYATSSFGNSRFMIAGADNTSSCNLYKGSTGLLTSYLRGGNPINSGSVVATGFFGSSRTTSSTISARYSGVDVSTSSTSSPVNTTTLDVFRSQTYPTQYLGDGRLAFYSIGESLDLAKLDARVTTLINAFGAAIP